MDRPVLLAIDDDAAALGAVERELRDRYERHYRIECLRSPADVRALLADLAVEGTEVAVVLAGLDLPGTTGIELLDEVHRTHPHARRALLVEFGEWGQVPVGDAILEGVAHGRLEQFILRPVTSPDERFHQSLSDMLLDWVEERRSAPHSVHVVGHSWSGRAYEIREALQQCAIPHRFCLADSEEGKALLDSVGEATDLPLLVFPNGGVLRNPTNIELAVAAGSPASPGGTEFDVVVVGAGPAGLSAAVYGSSEGLGTLVVDRGGIGGQATSSSLIRNYLGFPSGVTGRRLARQAYDQAWIFGTRFTFMQTVTDIAPDGDQLVVSLADFGPVRTSTVLLATGAHYRRLGVPSLEALVGAGVYYTGPASEAPALCDSDVFVVGGANSAGQAVLFLARWARKVTLVVRAASLRAGMSEYLVSQVEATPNIEVRLGAEVVDGGGDGRLEHLVVRDRATGVDEAVAAQALFALIGAQPHTDWLPPSIARDPQGFVLTGADVPPDLWPLERRPFALETSLPRVLAAGDVRAGSVKRVASAVGEGSIAVQLLHRLFAAEQRQPRGRTSSVPSAPSPVG